MTGTEKQIAWANDILSKTKAIINNRREKMINEVSKFCPVKEADEKIKNINTLYDYKCEYVLSEIIKDWDAGTIISKKTRLIEFYAKDSEVITIINQAVNKAKSRNRNIDETVKASPWIIEMIDEYRNGK